MSTKRLKRRPASDKSFDSKRQSGEENFNSLRHFDPLPLRTFALGPLSLPAVQHQILDEKLHHPVLPEAGMSDIRSDLNFEALAGFLQRLDELHGVVRV